MKPKINVHLEPTPVLRSPVMVCGLPDSGNVAKLVIDHLVKQLKAQKFADIYCNAFPPRVTVREDGTVDPMKHSMYFWKNNGGADIILYTGDAQPSNPEAAYALADKALEIAQNLHTDHVIAVGAYITGEFSEKPRVFATGTDETLIKELQETGVSVIKAGSITWMNGLIVGLCKLRNLKSIFLSGETSGYVVDANAARAILKVLGDRLKIHIDLTDLEKLAKETESLVKSIKESKDRTHPEKGETGYIG